MGAQKCGTIEPDVSTAPCPHRAEPRETSKRREMTNSSAVGRYKTPMYVHTGETVICQLPGPHAPPTTHALYTVTVASAATHAAVAAAANVVGGYCQRCRYLVEVHVVRTASQSRREQLACPLRLSHLLLHHRVRLRRRGANRVQQEARHHSSDHTRPRFGQSLRHSSSARISDREEDDAWTASSGGGMASRLWSANRRQG